MAGRMAPMAAAATVAALLLSVIAPAAAQVSALHEPASGQVMFGAWVQTEEGDTPAQFNTRLGLNATVVQIAQQIPTIPYNYVTGAGGLAPEELIERSATDAAVFLTVYPNQGLTILTDDDYTALGNQLLNYTSNYNRACFLRFAPEMNGDWNVYGLMPLQFVQTWRQMYTAIKAIAPQTAIVWAPNTGQGYPYSMPAPSNATEAAALDTSGDGNYGTGDDPFAPFYPGDDYVDWIGLSVYYKGPNNQNINVAQPAGYCYGAMQNYNPNTGTNSPSPWYNTYCNKAGKACMFAESGAAYHDMISGDQGVSDVVLKRAWWQDCLTNTSFYDTFPRLKLMMQFEYEKNETDGGIQDHRDYRLTNHTDVLSGFQSDLATMTGEVFTWANYRPIPVSTPNVVTATQIRTTTNAAGETVTETSRVTTSTFSFITVRNTQTGFPSLFGEFASSSVRAVVVSVAMFVSTATMVLAGTIFLMRI